MSLSCFHFSQKVNITGSVHLSPYACETDLMDIVLVGNKEINSAVSSETLSTGSK